MRSIQGGGGPMHGYLHLCLHGVGKPIRPTHPLHHIIPRPQWSIAGSQCKSNQVHGGQSGPNSTNACCHSSIPGMDTSGGRGSERSFGLGVVLCRCKQSDTVLCAGGGSGDHNNQDTVTSTPSPHPCRCYPCPTTNMHQRVQQSFVLG